MAVSESVGGGRTNLVSSNAPLLLLYYISSKLLSDKDQYNIFQFHFQKSKGIPLHSVGFLYCVFMSAPLHQQYNCFIYLTHVWWVELI